MSARHARGGTLCVCTSCGVNSMLAAAQMTMQLLPSSSTKMGATPLVVSDVTNTCVVSTPFMTKFAVVSTPNESSPTFVTIAVFAPSIAACTHWFAP